MITIIMIITINQNFLNRKNSEKNTFFQNDHNDHDDHHNHHEYP